MLTIVLLTLLLATPVSAEDIPVEKPVPPGGAWSPIGLQGEEIRAICADPVHPESIYAATRNAVHRMAGGSWYMVSKDLADASIYSLRVASGPKTGATLYVGTGGILYEGISDGRSWDSILNEMSGVPFHALALSSTGRLYAGNEYGVMSRPPGEEGWNTDDQGMTSGDVRVLIVDPRSASTVYAGTATGGVYKSTDEGKNWKLMHQGMNNRSIRSLTIDPSNSAVIFAGTSTGGFFRSNNGGDSWSALETRIDTGAITSILVDPSDHDILYAGTEKAQVIRSVDQGSTWQAFRNGLPEAGSATILAAAGKVILAGNGNGVYKLLQDAASVAEAKKKAAAGKSAPDTQKATGPVVRAIAIDPASTGTLYIGTSGEGVLKSQDAGKHWTRMDAADAGSVVSLAVDPGKPNIIYAGTRGKFLRSTDSGTSWETMLTDLANPYFYVAAASGVVYRANEYGIHHSRNHGDDWSENETGETVKGARSIALDPGANIAFVGTDGGIFRSEDGGTQWISCGAEVSGPVTAIVAVPSSAQVEAVPGTVYAAADGGGVFRSDTHCRKWQTMNDGLSDLSVQTLTVDPRSPGTVYAGTFGSGIFKSTDGGKHWRDSSSGLVNRRVRALAIDPANPSTLYAGTEGGVYQSTNSGGSWKLLP